MDPQNQVPLPPQQPNEPQLAPAPFAPAPQVFNPTNAAPSQSTYSQGRFNKRTIKASVAILITSVFVIVAWLVLQATVFGTIYQLKSASNSFMKAIDDQNITTLKELTPNIINYYGESQFKSSLSAMDSAYSLVPKEYNAVVGTENNQSRAIVFYQTEYKNNNKQTYIMVFLQKNKSKWQVVDLVQDDNKPKATLSLYNNSYFSYKGGDGSAGDSQSN